MIICPEERKGLVFKVDFEKAFDHVEWSFVEHVLEDKGFGTRWRSLIMGCFEFSNFSVLINGGF